MADNTTLNIGTGGDVIASDDIGGVKYQRVKNTFGADGVATDVSSTNPMPVVATLNGIVSTVNGTTTNLAGGAVFTGTSEDVSEFSTMFVSIFSSHVSATDGLSVQFSSDGTNWDFTDVFTIPAATGKVFSFGVVSKFYRLVYTNGATLTTSLRIQSLFSRTVKKSSSQRPSDARTNENDFEEQLCYNMEYNGSTWDRSRGLSVDLTTGDAGAKTATGNGATQTNIGNKGIQIFIVLGAVSGTAPTAVFKLQGSVDGGTNFYDIPGATTASLILGTSDVGITLYPGIAVTAGATTANTTAGANGVLPRTWRVVWTIGGTTPSFTITSINYNYLKS